VGIACQTARMFFFKKTTKICNVLQKILFYFYFFLFFKKVEPCHIPMAFFLFIRISRSIVVLLKKNLRAFLCFYNTKSGTLQFFFFFFFNLEEAKIQFLVQKTL
jgi:hypothetical protein